MGRHFRPPSAKPENPSLPPSPGQDPDPDLLSPFGKIEGLDRDDFREAAYEVFFTACRSSPGFGGRNPITYYGGSSLEGDAPGSPMKPHQGVGMAVTSRVKAALGLKMMRRSPPSRRASACGASSNNNNPSSPGSMSPRVSGFSTVPPPRLRRPMTAAEIIRQQMRVTEQSDNRMRKTLMKTLVGQMGRRAETIILPLELLRHLKPSEFEDPHEYHLWQRRQLRILEVGLLLQPSSPLHKSDPNATKLRDIIRACNSKPIDTSRNSRNMKALCDCVSSLAWRCPSDGGGSSNDVCHWADGYPLNVHIYMALLSTVFDLKDETLMVDEVDELLELMKKTWTILGLTRPMHNLCLTWVLFEQFVATGQTAPDLLGAAFVMLKEVESDAKMGDREPAYVKMLASVLSTLRKYSERRLLDYHRTFGTEMVGQMESMLPLLFSSSNIMEQGVPLYVVDTGDEVTGNRIEHCIRSSLRNAFARIVEEQNGAKGTEAQKMTGEALIKLAVKTEELGTKEKELFSPTLKKWSPAAVGIAAVTLHACYGIMLKQYLTGKSCPLNDMLLVLQRAGKLEKALVEMVVEDECEDGAKGIVKQMVPYEVETIIRRLLKQWNQERLNRGKECLLRAKQTETWKPTSKTEPHAHSATELVSFAKEAMESFFQLSVSVSEYVFYDFINGLQNVFLDYITFVAACGSKHNYVPTLPPPTRCSNDSTIFKLWKKAACNVGVEEPNWDLFNNEDNNHPRASTSRGTQRLYIRLNTLHYLMLQLNSIEKALSISPNVTPTKSTVMGNRRQPTSSYFDKSLSTLQAASQHVSEVAAYRLVFLDSNSVFFGSLYMGGVGRARIGPAIKSLKHNLTLLCAIVVERAQPQALREVMKASFEAFLRVLLAGGSSRVFSRMDHQMIEEDVDNLKRMFCTCGDGLIVEDMVERESEAAQGVVALMGQPTEQLIEDFISVMNGANGMNIMKAKHKLPIPPTTGNWNRSDPNTILRVLCSRNDRTTKYFLKKTFRHLPKRRPGIRMM